jgi:hypothetical protein
VTTPAERTAALSRMAHDEYLSLGLNDIPACVECQALSGLLTGLVRMAREVPGKAEYIEALVAEAAETLGLVEPEPILPRTSIYSGTRR